MLKVELVSKEMMIKPSSPTPPHLKTLKLSYIDQISPPAAVLTPLIFFFQTAAADNGEGDDHGRTSQLLKQSLSKVLSLFYPLAGRIKGNTCIDCSDDGALYVEARVHGFLKDVVENPLMGELRKFVRVDNVDLEPPFDDDGQLILAVQVNYFLEGGIAVGVSMSHKIADGLSLVNFVNAWAVTAREGDAAAGISPPNFGLSSSLFPPTRKEDLPYSGFAPFVDMTREKAVTRRLVFDKEKLAALKQSAAAASWAGGVRDPTRVEALSAFLWKQLHFKEASTKKQAAVHAVNLRGRMDPPLPDATFGNLWRPAIAVSSSEATETQDLVLQLRNSIRKINSECAKSLQKGKCNYLEQLREMLRNGEEVEFCCFSSWCRFPIYEVDFGWGRPVWACTFLLPYENVIVLMSTRSGDGIEAFINMQAEDHIWDLPALPSTATLV